MLRSVLSIFKQGTTNFTFLQYFWIREHILSILQGCQTKIISFVENGEQNQQSRLMFFSRNSHNSKSLGTGFNHSDILFDHTPQTHACVPKSYLDYGKFEAWKTNIGINSFKDDTQQAASTTKVAEKKIAYEQIEEDSGMKSMK